MNEFDQLSHSIMSSTKYNSSLPSCGASFTSSIQEYFSPPRIQESILSNSFQDCSFGNSQPIQVSKDVTNCHSHMYSTSYSSSNALRNLLEPPLNDYLLYHDNASSHEQESSGGIMSPEISPNERKLNHDLSHYPESGCETPASMNSNIFNFSDSHNAKSPEYVTPLDPFHHQSVKSVDSVVPDTTNKCNLCSKTFQNMSFLRNHILKHDREELPFKRFKCSHCAYSSQYTQNLSKHVSSMHDRSYTVVTVPQKIVELQTQKTASYSSFPMKTVEVDKPMTIAGLLCSESPPSEPNSKEIHPKSCVQISSTTSDILCGPYVEGRCHTVNASALMFSKSQVNGSGSTEAHQCRVCQKCFRTKQKLTHHLDRHDDRKPYLCEEPGCERAFRTPKYLKNHMNDHRGQAREHTCVLEHCQFVCNRRAQLKRHVSECHPKLKMYRCNWLNCDATFKTETTLQSHTKNHEVTSALCCKHCNFKANLKEALIDHYTKFHPKVESQPHDFTSSSTNDHKKNSFVPIFDAGDDLVSKPDKSPTLYCDKILNSSKFSPLKDDLTPTNSKQTQETDVFFSDLNEVIMRDLTEIEGDTRKILDPSTASSSYSSNDSEYGSFAVSGEPTWLPSPSNIASYPSSLYNSSTAASGHLMMAQHVLVGQHRQWMTGDELNQSYYGSGSSSIQSPVLQVPSRYYDTSSLSLSLPRQANQFANPVHSSLSNTAYQSQLFMDSGVDQTEYRCYDTSDNLFLPRVYSSPRIYRDPGVTSQKEDLSISYRDNETDRYSTLSDFGENKNDSGFHMAASQYNGQTHWNQNFTARQRLSEGTNSFIAPATNWLVPDHEKQAFSVPRLNHMNDLSLGRQYFPSNLKGSRKWFGTEEQVFCETSTIQQTSMTGSQF